MDPYDAMSLGDIDNWNAHFLNVVTETVYDISHHYFWSEKVFKPIIGKRPFIVYSKNAFDFFDKTKIIPYYDDFSDICDLDLTNHKNIPDFLKILNSQEKSYFQQKYNSLKDKIDYNYQIFCEYYSSNIKKQN